MVSRVRSVGTSAFLGAIGVMALGLTTPVDAQSGELTCSVEGFVGLGGARGPDAVCIAQNGQVLAIGSAEAFEVFPRSVSTFRL
jgi:hypothetical protein